MTRIQTFICVGCEHDYMRDKDIPNDYCYMFAEFQPKCQLNKNFAKSLVDIRGGNIDCMKPMIRKLVDEYIK
jgi:hypothetical protein